MSDICPGCNEEVTKKDELNDNVFYNGGGQFGEFPSEKWHKECSEVAEEWERENNKRR